MFAGEGEIIPSVLAFEFVKKIWVSRFHSLCLKKKKDPSQFINEAEPKKKKSVFFFLKI